MHLARIPQGAGAKRTSKQTRAWMCCASGHLLTTSCRAFQQEHPTPGLQVPGRAHARLGKDEGGGRRGCPHAGEGGGGPTTAPRRSARCTPGDLPPAGSLLTLGEGPTGVPRQNQWQLPRQHLGPCGACWAHLHSTRVARATGNDGQGTAGMAWLPAGTTYCAAAALAALNRQKMATDY